MKRLVTAVFSHETNTFSPISTPLKSFGVYTGGNGPVSGDPAINAYQGTNPPVAAFIDMAKAINAKLNLRKTITTTILETPKPLQ